MILRSRACLVGFAMIPLMGFVPTTQAQTVRPDASEAFSKLLLSRQNKAMASLVQQTEKQDHGDHGKHHHGKHPGTPVR